MTRPSRDCTMMHIATAISKRSTCARRSVGCVLTNKYGRIISIGHNGVPKDFPHCTDVPCAGVSFPSGTRLNSCESIHAEQNAIAFCHDIMDIDTCYTTTSPCESCLKQLLNTSCKRIVFFDEYTHPHSKEMWETAGREWVHYTENIPEVFYTYMHCTPDGIPFYIGKGKKKRAWTFTKRNPHHLALINKYGGENLHVVVIPMVSETDAFELEKSLIDLYRPICKLTNMTNGGEGGLRSSEIIAKSVAKAAITRKQRKIPGRKGPMKMSQEDHQKRTNAVKKSWEKRQRTMSDKQKEKISNSSKGRKFSNDHIKNLSNAMTGKIRSLETRIKIAQTKKGKKLSQNHKKAISKGLTKDVKTI